MKLYFSPGACSLASHIALAESGIKFDSELVNLKEHKTKSGKDFYQINPKGYVPALEIEPGHVLTEGAVILQFIADKSGSAKLAPTVGSMDRYRCQEWLNFIATEVHRGFSPLWAPTAQPAEKERATQNLHRRFDYLNKHLSENDFIMGAQWTIADAYLFTVLSWSAFIKMDLKPWPALEKYLQRNKERPAVQQALKAEGLI